MDSNLLSALIEKEIVKSGTEITALRPGFDLSRIYPVDVEEILEIRDIYKHKAGHYIVNATSIKDARSYKIKAEHINIIDGMVPKTLATIYNIRENGSIRPIGKKRGRKAKIRTE